MFYHQGFESGSYAAILACGEIVVHGTGSQTITISKVRTLGLYLINGLLVLIRHSGRRAM